MAFNVVSLILDGRNNETSNNIRCIIDEIGPLTEVPDSIDINYIENMFGLFRPYPIDVIEQDATKTKVTPRIRPVCREADTLSL